jgi:two-component system alkaline phosphatase synthesis response regulator PhoP
MNEKIDIVTETKSEIASNNAPIKVVAIDDEADILKMIQRKLEKNGFKVFTASDGEEGVIKVVAEKPDAMIVDVMMPKKDGYQVCKEVKETLLDQAPLIIMLTSKTETSDIIKGLSEGADDYISKPFSPHELIERINVGLIKKGKISGDNKSG